MRGTTFDDEEDLKTWLNNFFDTRPGEFWRNGINKLVERWEEVSVKVDVVAGIAKFKSKMVFVDGSLCHTFIASGWRLKPKRLAMGTSQEANTPGSNFSETTVSARGCLGLHHPGLAQRPGPAAQGPLDDDEGFPDEQPNGAT
ncbi:hypothetical protein LAZ67_13001576 [Cordylochernes scorpioides]|uniref:Uncharacterized protein n=1 Tax=Cordylochernes scorpioides TaxID=51811 RepID=A0ABY6L6M2_9ARAC|nr:hypothetical protein LAZ67_13001576 [Cordylochernes scorpioides]